MEQKAEETIKMVVELPLSVDCLVEDFRNKHRDGKRKVSKAQAVVKTLQTLSK